MPGPCEPPPAGAARRLQEAPGRSNLPVPMPDLPAIAPHLPPAGADDLPVAMSPSDSKALHQPAAISWPRYRQWTRENLPLWVLTIVFTVALLIVARSDVLDTVYLAFVLFPAVAIAGVGETKAVLGAWTVRACLAFLAFMWLTPLWTGGIGDAPWVDTTLAMAAVAGFVMIIAHLVASDPAYQDRLIKVLAVAVLVTALYSAVTEYQAHWFTDRLVIVPWPNPNTGAAVLGTLLVGIAAGPGMNSEEWPGVRMIYWAIAVLLALLLFMTQTRAALVGVVAAALAAVLVRPPKLRNLAVWGAVFVVAVGLVVFVLRHQLLRGDAGRTELLVDFWRLVQDRVLLGFGVQTQGDILVWYNGLYLEAPHNMLMTALVYGGVIAAALLAALYVTMIVIGIRNARRGLSLAPLAMAVYVAAHGLFETIYVTTPGWQWLYLWLPVGIVAGAELRGRAPAA